MIGVFDSGQGGLTVLRALTQALPERRYIYLGDHAYAPYGMRSNEEIYQLTKRRVADLFERGCTLVIIACNTASAVALRRLQQEWLPHYAADRRILGVFVPLIEALTEQDWYVTGTSPYGPKRQAKNVAVFATKRTVESMAFPQEVARLAPEIQVLQQPCPRLAESIDEGLSEDLLRRGVARYVDQLLAKAGSKHIDIALLACTHFPIVEGYFREALPRHIRLMRQPDIVAAALIGYLKKHHTLVPTQPAGQPVDVVFLTSGDPESATALTERFFGMHADFWHIRAPSTPVSLMEQTAKVTPDRPPISDPVTGGEDMSNEPS